MRKRYIFEEINIRECVIKVSFLIMVVLILTYSVYRVYNRVILPKSKTAGRIYGECVVDDNEIWKLESGKTYCQNIVLDRNGLINILIKLPIIDIKNIDWIIVQLKNSEDELIEEWCKSVEEINLEGYTSFVSQSPLIGVNGKAYSIVINCLSKGQINDTNSQQAILIDEHLEYALQGTGYDFLTKYYSLCASILIIFTSVFFAYLLFGKIYIERFFVPFTLVFATFYLIVFPPFASPDDYAHFVASFQLSEKMLGHSLPDTSEQIAQDVLLCDGDFTRYATAESYKYVWDGLHGDSDESASNTNNFYEFVGTMGHYVPALGITVAKLLGLPYVYMIYFGRFFNILFWSLMGYIIIKIIPIGKNILFVVSALPMTMQLISSFSRDAYIFELSFLFLAYILHLVYKKENIRLWHICILSLLLFLLLPCKYVYVLVGFLVFLLPYKNIKHKKGYIMAIILTVCFLATELGYSLITENSKSSDDQRSVTTEAVLGENPQVYEMSDVISNPLRTLGIFANTIRDKSGFYINTMLGGLLGSLEIKLSESLVFGFLILLLMSCLVQRGECYKVTLKQRTMFLAVFFMVAFAILGAMLIEWTFVTEDTISGIQGRYFLPVLPLLCLGIRNEIILAEKNITRYIAVGSVFLEFYTVLYCLEEIVVR